MSVAEIFNEFVRPFTDSGWQGFVLTVLAGWLLIGCFFPVTPVIFASGFLLGFYQGWAASQLILMLSLLHGLFLGGKLWQYIGKLKFAQNKYFEAIRHAIEADGMYLVALLRMTPFLHYPTGNLFFGTLKINRVRYLMYSLLGMLPGSTLIVYAGSIGNSLVVRTEEIQVQQYILLGIGIAVFMFVCWVLVRRVRQYLDQQS